VRDALEPVHVLIVDDDDLMRAGLKAVLSSDATIEVVGEAAYGTAAVREAGRLDPDVVLMDIRMPGLDGIAATRELLALLRQDRHARESGWREPQNHTVADDERQRLLANRQPSPQSPERRSG
jgi:CheY-like chemotaxis protein